MVITFDARKNRLNIAAHGYDFSALTVEFFEASVVVPAKQGRFMAIGEFQSRIVAVVFVRLGTEGVSVISMRPTSRKERKLHDES